MVINERGYAIIGTPRSGTTHLCWLLSSTGVLGKPREYLHPDFAALVSGPSAAVPDDMWESIKQASRTENGVYAIKTFRDHLARFDATEIHRKILGLPLVFMTRDDKLGQAISLVRAMQTRQWNSKDGQSRSPEYDAASITNCLERILLQEIAFKQTIAVHGLPSLMLTYEDYVEQPVRTVQAIGALVGVDRIDAPLESPLAIQRDEINAAWRERYVAEQGPPIDIPRFELNDRWSRFGRKLRRIKRHLSSMTSSHGKAPNS